MKFDFLKKKEDEIEPEDRKGTWDDSGYKATDEEAHRNAKYFAPSPAKQIGIVFMNQMKIFAKAKFVYFMIIAAVSMPIIMNMFHDQLMMLAPDFIQIPASSPNCVMAISLCMFPMVLALFTSVLCGAELPNEYKFRTAYLNMPLPMSKGTFYIGKYLAGFVLCLGVTMFAFAMAILTTSFYYSEQHTGIILKCILVAIVAVFVYTATAYCIGSFMKKGSTIVPFIILFVVLPLIMAVGIGKFEIQAFQYMPSNLCEMVLALLGAQMGPSIGSFFLTDIDVVNIFPALFIGIVWGAAMLALGHYRNLRREM